MGKTQVVTGVVLAGGMGRRLGRDKTLLRLPGQDEDLLARAARVMASVGVKVLVACGSEQANRAERTGFPLLADRFPGQGSMMGLYSVLEQLAGPCLVMACDMPFLRKQELESLLRARETRQAKADASEILSYMWRNAENGKAEPLAALYEWESLPFFQRAAKHQDFALHRVIPPEHIVFLDYGPEQAKYFMNINRQEDLDLAMRLASDELR